MEILFLLFPDLKMLIFRSFSIAFGIFGPSTRFQYMKFEYFIFPNNIVITSNVLQQRQLKRLQKNPVLYD